MNLLGFVFNVKDIFCNPDLREYLLFVLLVFLLLMASFFAIHFRLKFKELITKMNRCLSITGNFPESIQKYGKSSGKLTFSEKCPDFSKEFIHVIGGSISLLKNVDDFEYDIEIQSNGESEMVIIEIEENRFTSDTKIINGPFKLEIPVQKEHIPVVLKEPIVTADVTEVQKTLNTGDIINTNQVTVETKKGPFDHLNPPKGDGPAISSFNKIQAELNDIFKEAREKFSRGELGLIGAGHIYPRILKLSALQEIGAVYGKSINNFSKTDRWYFLGDIHGDYLAFYTILEEIKKDPNFKICFLGDLVDRGPYGAECFALLLKMAMEFPNRIAWILGNHDEIIKWDLGAPKQVFDKSDYEVFSKIRKNLPRFYALLYPAEFLDWLNDNNPTVKKERNFAGNLFCEIASVLPRCILFPNGILASHAGFPLKDRWDSLKNLEDFYHPRCLDDFTWNRIQSSPDAFILNDARNEEKSWTFGWDTIANFRDKVKGLIDFNCLIRGHDHLTEGWEIHQKFVRVPVLTLNSFGFNNISNSLQRGSYKKEVVYFIAESDGTLKPENIKKVPIHEDLLEQFYSSKVK